MSLAAGKGNPRGRIRQAADSTAVSKTAADSKTFKGLRPCKGPHLRERI